MGLSLSTAMPDHTQHNLRHTNDELQYNVNRLEKEIIAAIEQNINSLDRLNAELKDSRKCTLEQKTYYEKELQHAEEKTSFFRDKLTVIEEKNKLLETKSTELQKDNEKLLSAIKTIDDISDKFD